MPVARNNGAGVCCAVLRCDNRNNEGGRMFTIQVRVAGGTIALAWHSMARHKRARTKARHGTPSFLREFAAEDGPTLSVCLSLTHTHTFGCHLGASTARGGLYANALSTDITRSFFCVCSHGSRRSRTAPQLKLLSSGST